MTRGCRAAAVLAIGLQVDSASSSPAPRLWVESAHLSAPDRAGGGRLSLTGSMAGVPFDGSRFLRVEVPGSFTRWLRLRRLPPRPGEWAVDGAEHGYAFRLDVRRGRFSLREPEVRVGSDRRMRLVVGQDGASACVDMWLRRRGAALVFAARRDRQSPCTNHDGGVP